MKNPDRIEKYLKGEMSDMEKEKFETEIKANPELQKEVNLVKDVDVFLSDQEELKFREKINTIVANERLHYKKRSIILNSNTFIRAASVLLIIGLAAYCFIIINQNKYEKLFEKYYTSYEYTEIYRSENNQDVENSRLQQALILYNNNEYNKAIELFNIEIQSNNKNTIVNFLTAICYIELEEIDKAISQLERLTNEENTLFDETIKWYLSLCYIKIEDKDKADMVLNTLGSYDNFYSEKANQILKRIR